MSEDSAARDFKRTLNEYFQCALVVVDRHRPSRKKLRILSPTAGGRERLIDQSLTPLRGQCILPPTRLVSHVAPLTHGRWRQIPWDSAYYFIRGDLDRDGSQETA